MGIQSSNGYGDRDKKSKSDGDGEKKINGDENGKCDLFLLTFINFAYHVVVLCSYRDLSLQPLVSCSSHLPLELDLKGFESMNLIFFQLNLIAFIC